MPKPTISADGGALPAEGLKSRRATLLLAGVSAAAVFPAAAIAASLEIDPVFAAIKRHNAAWRLWSDAISRSDRAEARAEGREVTDADVEAFDAATDAERDAFREFIKLSSPVTVPGFLAFEDEWPPGSIETFLTTLLASPLLGRASR